MKQVFIAAPIFSQAEQEYNIKINEICQNLGFQTFMAQRDVGVVHSECLKDFFLQDLYNLQNADIIVANLDGIDVDSGTAWEIGYAYSTQKPIIGLRSDVRMYRDFLPVNLMIHQSCKIITTIDHLAESLLKYKSI